MGLPSIGPPSAIIGTRDMDSTPPATSRSYQPERTFSAAMPMASSPEEQKRLICTPATVSAHPAASTAQRAISAPWSPTGMTQPMMTSSISAVSSALRPCNAFSSVTTRSIGGTSYSEPSFFPLPRGVRMASKM